MSPTGEALAPGATAWVYLLIGVVSLIGAILALANPLQASISVNLILAWTFVAVGIVQLVFALRASGVGGSLWALVLGVLFIVLGGAMLYNPMASLISLTLLVASLFLVIGLFKLLLSFRLRPLPMWPAMFVSGLASVVLAGMILGNVPVAAASILGVLLGVELLINGLATVLVGLAMRRGRRVHPGRRAKTR
ncbi:MAG: DUF308 domain-containing protein [Burkholderiaceae bacterium]